MLYRMHEPNSHTPGGTIPCHHYTPEVIAEKYRIIVGETWEKVGEFLPKE